ncbi:CobD/CbiB family cobalamin biosynthesis protein [Desulfohalovibrio reitneri]|uniref:CobD/CbiB family cobalamin biosynthesis protein n=1 Tax=Desulfohalovibrio reitneri TaxID=1307759 RepID=UPI000552AC89|nr:CobD/CbiB family cobalamin biosynthesis protein [Desulfohalovibrio reitneri]
MESTHALLILLAPPLALLLDLLLGDRPGLPHPVRLLGGVLDRQERLSRRLAPGKLFAAGVFWTVVNAAAAWAVVQILTEIPYLGALIGLYFAYAGLALGQLLRESRKVRRLLAGGDLNAARTAVGQLVSRETGDLDEEGVRRTLAESISENLCDGFVAPFLFLCLGGPALLWAYKAISTMDSMWGYRTEKYERLGRFCARADDVLAWVPARLTAALILLAGRVTGRRVEGWKTKVPADAARMESPNAGWPMAAAAWVCGAPMGGSAVYHGQTREKPRLGPDTGVWDESRLRRLHRLCLWCGLGGGLLIWLYFAALAWSVSSF